MVQQTDVVFSPFSFRQEMQRYSYILYFLLQTENYLSGLCFALDPFSLHSFSNRATRAEVQT